MRCTQPASCSTTHFQFRWGCWATRDSLKNDKDHPHISGLGRSVCPVVPKTCTEQPLPLSVLWWLPSAQPVPVLTPLFRRCQIAPSLSLQYTWLFASQHEFSPFYYRSNNQLVLRGALLGKSADRASASWISLLLLWFNTNIIFCDQMADASLPPRAWLYPFKPQRMNFTTVKRQGKGE